MAHSNDYYYSDITSSGYFNTLLASTIAIEQHFGTKLFNNDLSRIIYSPNEFCFKDRLRVNKHESDLRFPFMNYYLKSSNKNTSPRSLWNNVNQVQGMLQDDYPELGTKIKIIPTTMSFEGTVFYSQGTDTWEAQRRLQMDQANESIIYTYYTIPDKLLNPLTTSGNNYQFKSPCFLTYDPDYNPEYDQNSWLEENQIFSIAVDFDIITFLLFANDNIIPLSNELILNFISAKNIDSKIDPVNYSIQELIQVILQQ